jgi:3-oxoacyl-[acyl-carrier-protein] synthase II
MTRRVAITGVGAVTPLGSGARTMFDRWSAGVCAIANGEGRCADFDPTDVMTAKEARRSARFVHFAVAAADEALRDAGWDGEPPYDSHRVGCIIGTGIGGLDIMEVQAYVLRERGARAVSALTVPLMMGNGAAGTIALRHGLRGEAYATVSACAAGAHAIGAAARTIASGHAQAVVAGGAESAMTPLSLAAFGAMGATSKLGVSRPFDARRDGFVMGEGAGVLVLEDHDAAVARGARILGEVAGYASTDDAHHITAPEPDGIGAARAIELALADAGVGAGDVDYVNAHGTSTPLNDRAEATALKRALGERAARVPVSSLKSATGHLIGAAGAVEAIATVLALRDRLAPPTLGLEEPEPGLDLDFVPQRARPLERRAGARRAIGLSNSFGFGGHNAVLCLAAA